MGHGRELGESWSAKDGMVGGVEVCHEEVHVLSTKVVGGAKLDWQGDLPQRLGRSARYNPQNGESIGMRSSFVRPNSVRAPTKRRLRHAHRR